MISNGFAGIVVVDVSTPNSPKDGGYYCIPHGCGFERCIWLKDSIRIICTCRELGIFFFEYSKVEKKINLINIVLLLGSENLKLSSNEDKLYVASGF